MGVKGSIETQGLWGKVQGLRDYNKAEEKTRYVFRREGAGKHQAWDGGE